MKTRPGLNIGHISRRQFETEVDNDNHSKHLPRLHVGKYQRQDSLIKGKEKKKMIELSQEGQLRKCHEGQERERERSKYKVISYSTVITPNRDTHDSHSTFYWG